MRRQALVVATVAGVVALASGGSASAARTEVLTVVVPGPTVTASTELRVGRRYKLVIRGTGASKLDSSPNLDFFYCFGSNCSGGPGTPVNLVTFCGEQGSAFHTGTGRIEYRDDHVYELTVERTFDTPTDAGPGFDVPGKLLFRTMAGDYLGECRRPEKDPGDLTIATDPFALDYIENGRALRGPGGTFTIEIADVGSIARPPTSTTGTKTPNTPSRPGTPASGLNAVVVGHHYLVGATGAHTTIHNGRLKSATGVYVVNSARIHMSSGFTYSGTRTGDAATGTAVVTLLLVRERGTGPRAVALPLTYRLGTAVKWTPDRAAREWRLSGTLVRPRVPGCEKGSFFVGALRAAYISFYACGIQVMIRPATVSIR